MCRSAAIHADGNRYDAGFRRSTPAHPCQLAVAVRVVDIADSVSPALNVKTYRYGVIWVGLATAHLHGGDNFCIDTVFIIKVIDLRWRGHLVEAYNADTKRGDDVAVGRLLRAATGPRSITEIRLLQKNRKRQILVSECTQLLSEIAVDDLVIQRRFRGGHGKLLTVVAKIGQRLYYQLVVSANECIEVHSCISSNGTDNLFIGKIASDGSNAGLAAARRDDLGQTLTWVSIGIPADRYGQSSSRIVRQLGHFSEVSNICYRNLVG